VRRLAITSPNASRATRSEVRRQLRGLMTTASQIL
jgi:hypothetical protein